MNNFTLIFKQKLANKQNQRSLFHFDYDITLQASTTQRRRNRSWLPEFLWVTSTEASSWSRPTDKPSNRCSDSCWSGESVFLSLCFTFERFWIKIKKHPKSIPAFKTKKLFKARRVCLFRFMYPIIFY